MSTMDPDKLPAKSQAKLIAYTLFGTFSLMTAMVTAIAGEYGAAAFALLSAVGWAMAATEVFPDDAS